MNWDKLEELVQTTLTEVSDLKRQMAIVDQRLTLMDVQLASLKTELRLANLMSELATLLTQQRDITDQR